MAIDPKCIAVKVNMAPSRQQCFAVTTNAQPANPCGWRHANFLKPTLKMDKSGNYGEN